MPTTARPLIGREEELGAIVRLLDDPGRLPGAAVLWGDAGVGKTSIWFVGIDTATNHGYRVLQSRPSEAETRLSYAGLADLLGDAAEEVLPSLPPVQRRALGAALLLGDAGPADERAVAAAFLASLRLLATERTLCVAVDDIQWLDAASRAALQFALSRLRDEQVATLVTSRGQPAPWLRRSLPEAGVVAIEVAGLSIGATHELLRGRLDLTVPRPTLVRLWEASAGNPFFALELADALRRRGEMPAPDEPLPIPATLDELLRDRLAGLSAHALEVARVAAALGEPTTTLVEAALGPTADAGLAEALDARVLELGGDRLRFTHPLLGTAVTTGQSPSGRRALHASLATVASSDEERARHLALATVEPDEEIAATLEAAALSAQARGAATAAAELAEQALRLTPARREEGVRRRLVFAAQRHHAAGDDARAMELLTRARADSATGPDLAEILVELAGVQALPRDAEALYEEALTHATGDDALTAQIHLGLAGGMRWAHGIERGVTHAALAVQAASRTEDVALRCRALTQYACWQCRAGRGIPRAEMEEALMLERTLPGGPSVNGPSGVLCLELIWTVELERARTLLTELDEARTGRDDPEVAASLLWKSALLEWRAGAWAEADRCALAAAQLMIELGRLRPPDEFPAAILAAHRGRIDEARTRSSDASARAEAEGIVVGQSGHGWVLGFVELSVGDAEAALPHLQHAHDLRNALMREPAQHLGLGDLLEAFVATGKFDEAEELLADWQPRAEAVDRAWALAILARGRGLLLAARGDLDSAFAAFERARGEHARDADPFQHARTLLALGRTQRRAKKRGDARATLEDALARFEALGAPLWAEQTRAELARIGGRAPSRGDLTEAERRIAELVAQGSTNKHVAAALFLTEHSVETALTRIYRKLGVRSRGELARIRSAEGPKP